MSNVSGVADLEPLAQQREQKAWYWYYWANSAFVTTVGTVMFAPYIIAVAKDAAVDNRIVVSARLARGSGDEELDEEAEAMIGRVNMPPLPDDYLDSTMSLVVPIRFSLR